MSKFNDLKSVSSLITKGTTPSSIGSGFTNDGINFVKSESITGSKYLNREVYAFIDNPTNIKLKRSQLQENDLLFSIAGAYLGKLAIVEAIDLPANTNQAVAIVRVDKKKVNVDYLYYYFSQIHINNYINKLSSQSSQPNLNLDLLGKLQFKTYELATQQNIAKVLSDLDAKIEINNKVNAELEAMAKTLYDYWFVQFDFPFVTSSGVEKPYKSSGGKMVWNEELKREIPEGWEINSLSSLVDCNKWTIKKDNSLTEINYLDTSSLTNNVICDIQKITCETEKVPSRAQRVISKNDILYSTVRPNQCHFGIIKDPMPNMIASTGFAQLRSKSKFVSNELIYTFLSSKIVTTRLQQIADTAVSAYPSISHNDILGLKIVLPHENRILLKTNSLLGDVYMKISLNQKENQQLASLRDWLLPMLMNGQVRVGDVEEELGMVAEPSEEYKNS